MVIYQPSTRILKQSTKNCSDTLHKLFNDGLRNVNFTDKLKCANTTPVSNKDDPKKQNQKKKKTRKCSTRSLEIFWKTNAQANVCIDQFLNPYMCGYKKSFSIQHVLLSLIEKWKKVLHNKEYGGAIPMNLSKAFDTINHDLLVAKLHVYGFSKELLK